MTHHIASARLLAAGLAMAAVASSAAPRYHLVDLGPADSIEVYAANIHGEMAGDAYDGRDFTAGKFRRHTWKFVRDDSHGSSANGVDAHGSLVGLEYLPHFVEYPMYWPKGGTHQIIPLPYTSPEGHANAISPQGAYIVGTGFGDDSWPRCFLWTGSGTAADLGTLGGMSCYAHAVNDAGQVGGQADVADDTTHAMVYDQDGMHDLGLLPGGSFATLYSINSKAHGVGEGDLPNTNWRHAIYWNGKTLVDMGTLGGPYSIAASINDADDIVGVARDAAGQDHAFLYTGGKMLPLDSLVDNGTGWDFVYASEGPVSIGPTGVIVGQGEHDGHVRLYKLVPTLE